jgi:hypothetical protein
MTEQEFNQDPNRAMQALLGAIVIDRLSNDEEDRLARTIDGVDCGILNRPWVKRILTKNATWTWEEYKLIMSGCF